MAEIIYKPWCDKHGNLSGLAKDPNVAITNHLTECSALNWISAEVSNGNEPMSDPVAKASEVSTV